MCMGWRMDGQNSSYLILQPLYISTAIQIAQCGTLNAQLSVS